MPTAISPTSVVPERGGVAGILVAARARESMVPPLYSPQELVTPSISYCLIKEQHPKDPVLLWLQSSPTFAVLPFEELIRPSGCL